MQTSKKEDIDRDVATDSFENGCSGRSGIQPEESGLLRASYSGPTVGGETLAVCLITQDNCSELSGTFIRANVSCFLCYHLH